MNKFLLVLLVAALAVVHQTSANQFSFSLPGNWGQTGKRGFSFALPGRWGNVKRGGIDCSDLNDDTVLAIYRSIHEEAARLNYCFHESKMAATAEPSDKQ